MIHKITFLLHHKKMPVNHLFSKQLKTSNRTNRLEVSFLSFTATKAVKILPAATIHTLSAQPSLRIEFGSLLAKLELEDVIRANTTQSLTGTYLLTLMNADRFQITVNRDVAP